MFIASKYNDRSSLQLQANNCIYVTDNAYDRQELLRMELAILKELDYIAFVPTGYHFLVRYLNSINVSRKEQFKRYFFLILFHWLKFVQASNKLANLAAYYAERNLQEYDSLTEQPNFFAAAALYAALQKIEQENYDESHLSSIMFPFPRHKSVWTFQLSEVTGLQERDIIVCARRIIQHVSEEPETISKRRLVAAKKKFASSKYDLVSSLTLPSF